MDIKDNCDEIFYEFQKNENKIKTSYNVFKKIVEEIEQLLEEIYASENPSSLKKNSSYKDVQKLSFNIQTIDDIYIKLIEIIENNLSLFPLLLKEMVSSNEFEIYKKHKLLGVVEKSIVTRSLIDYDYYDFYQFFKKSTITNISINNKDYIVSSKKGIKKIIMISCNLENKNMQNLEELVLKYQLNINDTNNIYIVHLGEEKYNEVIEIAFSEVC